MSKHTPGPWYADGPDVWTDEFEGKKIATCEMKLRTTNLANARFIAAAPRLHSELKDLLNVLDHLTAAMPILGTSVALTAARAAGQKAIAEAEGTDSHG